MLLLSAVHCGGRCQADGDGGMGWEAWQVVGDIALPRVRAHARVRVSGAAWVLPSTVMLRQKRPQKQHTPRGRASDPASHLFSGKDVERGALLARPRGIAAAGPGDGVAEPIEAAAHVRKARLHTVQRRCHHEQHQRQGWPHCNTWGQTVSR